MYSFSEVQDHFFIEFEMPIRACSAHEALRGLRRTPPRREALRDEVEELNAHFATHDA